MNQLVTLFRAEGVGAARLRARCHKMKKSEHDTLLGELKEGVTTSPWITGYVSFLDAWSMGDDFAACFPPESTCRETSRGSVSYAYASEEWLAQMKQRNRRKHQFAEQAFLASTFLHLLNKPSRPGKRMAIALFRNVF